MCWFIKLHFSPNLPQDSPLLMNHTLVPRISTYNSFSCLLLMLPALTLAGPHIHQMHPQHPACTQTHFTLYK